MGVSAYLSLIGMRRGWALIRGWVLINFFCLWDGRLFEVGANSRLGAYSNNYAIPSDMCFLGMGTHNIKYIGHYNDIIMKHISLWICISWVVEHISLGICVSWVRETHFTVDMCFPCRGTPTTRDLFFLDRRTLIARDLCFLCRGTYATRDICFLCRGAHIPSDMCFLGRGTHIIGNMCSPTHDHISLVIMCFLGWGNTYS